MRNQSRDFPIFAGCLVVLALVACGNYETPELGPDAQSTLSQSVLSQSVLEAGRIAPLDSALGDFFPLVIGNQWKYHSEFKILDESGPPYIHVSHFERSVIGTENLFGRDYKVIQEVTLPEDGTLGEMIWTIWFRYRQDKAGLYSADTAASEPPGGILGARQGYARSGDTADLQNEQLLQQLCDRCPADQRDAYIDAYGRLLKKLAVIDGALRGSVSPQPALAGPPGGVLSNEITILKYPLHPGQQWEIRNEIDGDAFLVTAKVEAQEVLDLPPGRIPCSRISIYSDILEPGDVALEWYGRAGFVREFIHVTIQIRDQDGEIIASLVSESDETLESLSLSRGRWQGVETPGQF